MRNNFKILEKKKLKKIRLRKNLLLIFSKNLKNS